MRRYVGLLACFGLALVCQAQVPQTPTPADAKSQTVQEKFIPAETSVAILPVVNIAGNDWPDLRKRQCDRGNNFLRDEFQKRGFKLIPADVVAKAMADQKLDLADEEQLRRSTFFEFGKSLNAQIVVVAVITHSAQKSAAWRMEGTAQMKVWLLDANHGKALLSGKVVEGMSAGSNVFGLEKGSERQVIAVANGLRSVLAEFFSNYPEGK